MPELVVGELVRHTAHSYRCRGPPPLDAGAAQLGLT